MRNWPYGDGCVGGLLRARQGCVIVVLLYLVDCVRDGGMQKKDSYVNARRNAITIAR